MTELRDRHTIPVDTALIKTKDGEFTMICERVSDTIAVVPRIAYSDGSPVTFTGQFSISFAGGYGIPFVGCLDCARAAAKRFAERRHLPRTTLLQPAALLSGVMAFESVSSHVPEPRTA